MKGKWLGVALGAVIWAALIGGACMAFAASEPVAATTIGVALVNNLATILGAFGALLTVIGGLLVAVLKFTSAARKETAEAKALAAKSVEATAGIATKQAEIAVKVDGALTRLLEALEAKAVAEQALAVVGARAAGVQDAQDMASERAAGVAEGKAAS